MREICAQGRCCRPLEVPDRVMLVLLCSGIGVDPLDGCAGATVTRKARSRRR
ncbi:MAG: hypothetical protein R2856_38830 [Caldilineaceae bacterium]